MWMLGTELSAHVCMESALLTELPPQLLEWGSHEEKQWWPEAEVLMVSLCICLFIGTNPCSLWVHSPGQG